MSETLAERIKTIRLKSGDTPAVAAKKVGVSRQGYVKWELGNTENMKLGNLITFCDKYHVDFESLIRGTIIILDEVHPVAGSKATPRPARSAKVFELAYSTTTTVNHMVASEPDPDKKLLLDGYQVAEPGLKRAILTLARESIAVFEQRNEKND